VDYLIKNEFGLSGGLADTTKTIDDLHRVQILDPAVGTGTFISAVIRVIYARLLKSGQKGRWPKYVHNDLLPRIHGFELMMAPYTIAHLKLAMAFKETGFKYFNRRLGIYLTNSLEETTKQEELFASFGLADSIAQESKEAIIIKNKTPIMVIIGNPPYSGESSNAQYTRNDVYKMEPKGGKLQERNSKWLNDDYVKFIRFAENMVEKTGEGIVAMITAHGYIDNPTFRGMRWHLMKTFDKIYVLDLHGNTNKKEKAPDGGEDKNVFNIKTGVAIIFGIKKKNSKSVLAKIYKADLYGKCLAKFKYLNKNLINSVKWIQINPVEPNYEWVARDEELRKEYNKGFSVKELFSVSSVGVVTSRDKFIIDSNKKVLVDRLQAFLRCQSPQEAKAKFKLRENEKWKIAEALRHEFDESNIIPISYRPFDVKYVYYHDDFIERSRKEVMRNFINGDVIGLVVRRQMPEGKISYFSISKLVMADGYIRSDNKGSESIFPLYLYSEDGLKKSNLNQEIIAEIQVVVGKGTPEDIFDYIYAVLHSPSYRKKYQEFLKIDFPRVLYPKNAKSFKKLVTLGWELRQLHLLESPKVSKFITTYPESGSDTVEKLTYKDGRVYINEKQYFGNVPEVAWNFYIGGYQPAQKWLKDRRGKSLTNLEIEHYQKMIVALVETGKIMEMIDREIEI
ncbi:N-6 DNA methylase, partial [Patescibacteria group bacterium]|nr:N-6 DNA methylase [Patescibacteria group bacterium]